MIAADNTFEFSIVIPAYNEEKRIVPTLQKTNEFFTKRGQSFEIIVVDDGSSDETSRVVESQKPEIKELKLIKFDSNQGKGAAVKNGVLAAKGKFVLFQDADGATPINEFERLLEALKSADIAIGSRALPSKETEVVSVVHRKILGRVFNFVANLFAAPGISDTQCGFKLFKEKAAKEVFSRQKLKGFSFDVEILYIARRLGFEVKEVAVNWHNVPGTKVNVVTDGLKMFSEIVLIKFLHRKL